MNRDPLDPSTEPPPPGRPSPLPDQREFRPGQLLGPYEIGELLGRGPASAVYRARDRERDRDVALKVLWPVPGRDATGLEHLVREIRALATLEHPNLCRIYDAGRAGDAYYVASELVAGLPLDRWLRTQPRREDAAAEIVRKLALALGRLHACGAVHGNIRPNNVWIGAGDEPKLLDARAVRLPDESLRCGEPEAAAPRTMYRAPECAGGVPLDPRCDVYGLGVLLREMLTCCLPSPPPGEAAVGPSPRVATVREPDSQLRAICQRAAAPDPAERYQSVSELAEALQGYLAAQRTTIPVRPARRRSVLLRAAAAVLLAVIGLIAFFGFGSGGPQLAVIRGTYVLYVRFPEAPGVRKNTPVQLSGVNIGRVADVEILEEGGVLVTLAISSKYKLRQSLNCRIALGSLLGDNVLEFVPGGQEELLSRFDVDMNGRLEPDELGKANALLSDGATLSDGHVQANPMRVLSNLERDIQSTLADLQNAGKESAEFMREIRRGTDLQGIPDDIRRTLAEIRETLERNQRLAEKAEANLNNLERVSRPLGERGPQIIGNIERSMESLNELSEQLQAFSEALNNGGGTLGRLVYDDELYQRWRVERTGIRTHDAGAVDVRFDAESVQAARISAGNTLTIQGGGLAGPEPIPAAADSPAHGRDASVLSGFDGPIRCGALTPDGKLLAVATDSRTAVVRESDTGRTIRSWPARSSAIDRLLFGPDGNWLATLSAGAVQLDGVRTELVVPLPSTDSPVTSLAFSGDGSLLATGHADGTAAVWDAATGKTRSRFRGHSAAVTSVAFDPQRQRIGAGDADDLIKVWATASGQRLLTLRGHAAPVSAVAFSPDGGRIVSGSADTTVRLWDAASGQEQLVLRGNTSAVRKVVFRGDGSQLAALGDNGEVLVWDFSTKRDRAAGRTGSRAMGRPRAVPRVRESEGIDLEGPELPKIGLPPGTAVAPSELPKIELPPGLEEVHDP